jgi:hypothetical protein
MRGKGSLGREEVRRRGCMVGEERKRLPCRKGGGDEKKRLSDRRGAGEKRREEEVRRKERKRLSARRGEEKVVW